MGALVDHELPRPVVAGVEVVLKHAALAQGGELGMMAIQDSSRAFCQTKLRFSQGFRVWVSSGLASRIAL